jgi:hypothetical protein
VHADAFLLDQLDLSPVSTMATPAQQVADYDRPPMTIYDLLVSWLVLERQDSPPMPTGHLPGGKPRP